MATSTERQVALEYKLNYFSVRENSNKFWEGRAYTDGTYEYANGRVGATATPKQKQFSSLTAARNKLLDMVREKEQKGYRRVNLVDGTFDPSSRVLNTPLGAISEQAVLQAQNLLRNLLGRYDVDLVDEYYRLIPHTFSGQIPMNLLRTKEQIQREMRLLQSIGTALAATSTPEDAFAAFDKAMAELSRVYNV